MFKVPKRLKNDRAMAVKELGTLNQRTQAGQAPVDLDDDITEMLVDAPSGSS